MFWGTKNSITPLFSSLYVKKFKIMPKYAQNVEFTLQKCEKASWFFDSYITNNYLTPTVFTSCSWIAN